MGYICNFPVFTRTFHGDLCYLTYSRCITMFDKLNITNEESVDRMKYLSVMVLGCLFSVPLTAHELPSTSLDSKQAVSVATSFSFNSSQIRSAYDNYGQFFDYNSWLTYKRAEKGLPPVRGETCGDQMVTVRTCGQVDHFYEAAMVGTFTCNAYASLHAASYPNGLIARFTGPSSFVDNLEAATGHHEFYDISQGIAFDCVYPIQSLPELPAEPSLQLKGKL